MLVLTIVALLLGTRKPHEVFPKFKTMYVVGYFDAAYLVPSKTLLIGLDYLTFFLLRKESYKVTILDKEF